MVIFANRPQACGVKPGKAARCPGKQGETDMRKLIAITAALGLFGITTLTPVAAKSGGKDKGAMASTHKTKKPAKAKKAKKQQAVILYRIAA